MNKIFACIVTVFTVSSLCAMDQASSSNSMDVELVTLPASSEVLPEKDWIVTFLKGKIESSDDHDFATLLGRVPQEERVQFCKDSLNRSQTLVAGWMRHFDKKHYFGSRKKESIVTGVTGGAGAIGFIAGMGLVFGDIGGVAPGLVALFSGLGGLSAVAWVMSNRENLDRRKRVIIDSQNYIQQCLQKYIPQESADTSEQGQNVSSTSNSNEMV